MSAHPKTSDVIDAIVNGVIRGEALRTHMTDRQMAQWVYARDERVLDTCIERGLCIFCMSDAHDSESCDEPPVVDLDEQENRLGLPPLPFPEVLS